MGVNNEELAIKMEKLQEYETRIRNERRFVDIKPYSHNIITLNLTMIEDLEIEGISGLDIIKKYNLDSLGW
tara:strand:+ start:84 stop:296 length:213 start_codon:yes stop_codon:yes gene_type:complete